MFPRRPSGIRAGSASPAALATRLGALAILLVVAACDGDEAQAPAAAAPRVVVEGVTSAEITDSAAFIGQVAAVEEVDLIARVDGFLSEALVADGAGVAKGDPLFRIEPDRFEAEVAMAEAEAARAAADLALAELDLERNAKLLERGTIAQAQYDQALAGRDAAKAVRAAAEAQVREARLNLSYTEIDAPFEGKLGRVQFSVGALVGPNAGPIASLVQLDPIEVAFALAERDFVNIIERTGADPRKPPAQDDAPQLPIGLTLPNGKAYEGVGRIVFVNNRVDPRTGAIGLRARFDNPRGLLSPGMFVNVIIREAKPTTRLTVPQSAVQRDQKGDFVLVVGSEGLIEQRYVELGDIHRTGFVVRDGLQEGESVVVEGLQRVRPGVPVEAVAAAVPAADPSGGN